MQTQFENSTKKVVDEEWSQALLCNLCVEDAFLQKTPVLDLLARMYMEREWTTKFTRLGLMGEKAFLRKAKMSPFLSG